MKKVSRLSALSISAVSVLVLTACHPPGEVDSDLKIDNASTFEKQADSKTSKSNSGSSSIVDATAQPYASDEAVADEEVQYVDCVAAPATEPSEVSLDCVSNSETVTDISWDTWDANSAEGTGKRLTDGATQADAEKVTIILSEPASTENGLTFTQVEVDGELVSP